MIWNLARGRMEVALEGHTATVIGARFSADGKRVVSYGADGTAMVWDVETGRKIAHLIAHEQTVLWAEFSPNGHMVVTASGDGTARVWNTESGVGISVLEGHTDKVYQARFSPDNFSVVTASEDGTVRLWQAATMKQLSRVLKGHRQQVTSIDFSADGRHVVTGSRDRSARVWDLDTGNTLHVLKGYAGIREEQVRDNALGEVVQVAFSQDGRYVVTAGEDKRALLRRTDFSGNATGEDQLLAPMGSLRIWSAGSGRLEHRLDPLGMGALGLVFSADGTRIIALPNHRKEVAIRLKGLLGRGWKGTATDWAGELDLPVWEVTSGQPAYLLRGLKPELHDVAFSPDGAWIATGDKGATRLWDASDGKPVRAMEASRESTALRFTSDSKGLFMRDMMGTGLWEVDTGRLIRLYPSPSIPFVDASLYPSIRTIVAWTPQGTVCLFDQHRDQALLHLETGTQPLRKALLSPDGALVVTIGWETVAKVWDARSGELLEKLDGHDDDILDAMVSPDGQWLGTVSEDYTARIWPLSSIKAVQ